MAVLSQCNWETTGHCYILGYPFHGRNFESMSQVVSYNCVDKYVRLFQHRATLSPLVSDNARPKKIPWWMEAYVEALVRIYPSFYLRHGKLQHLLLKRL